MSNLNTTFKITLLAAFVLLAGSCKKEIIPSPQANSPVFKAEGTFAGEAVSLNAGDNNVLMSTESAQVNGVDFYKGILGNEQFKIELGLFAGDVDLVDPEIPDYSSVNELGFAMLPMQPLYKISKDSFPNSAQINHIQWEVNGAMSGPLNVLEIYEPGKYQVCAHVTFTDYTHATLCNEVIVGFKTNADFELNFFLGQDLTFKSWIKTFGSVPQSVQWFIDGNPAAGNTDELNTTLDDAIHLIRAEVVFANGAKRSKTIMVDGGLSGNNIHDFTKAGMNSPLMWDYMAKVKVIKNGIEYTSENAPNNLNKITVGEIRYYGLNQEGEPVYMLNGTINVNLKSPSGNIFPLNLDVSFGFAVK